MVTVLVMVMVVLLVVTVFITVKTYERLKRILGFCKVMRMMGVCLCRWGAGAQRPGLTSKILSGQMKAGFHQK